MKTKDCPRCDAKNNLNAKRCYNCGYNFAKANKIIDTIIVIALIIGAIQYLLK